MDKFRPDIYQKSIYDTDYIKLKKRGIPCLVFDLLEPKKLLEK